MAQTVRESSLALRDEGPMPELGGAVGWVNSGPLTRDSIRGKVVLVDIWTYSCINSIRQFPYLKNWASKYKDQGLVVLGVHSPEFGFEKDQANVERAVRDFKLDYPNAIDSRMDIWQAFNNEYWPADYFVDAKERIRYHHFGEGDYDQSERVIQQLLRENGATRLAESVSRPSGEGIEASISIDVRTPETYAGYLRTDNFASPEGLSLDSTKAYSIPARPGLNEWGLGGSWKVGSENATLEAPNGKIAFRFHARDVHMVLGSRDPSKSIHYSVTLDGSPPGINHGVDSEPLGSGGVQEPRLYQLIRQKGPVIDRTFEIQFLDLGVQAYSFTFG